MNKFIEILSNYKLIACTRDDINLSKWIALLSKFNDFKPLDKSLVTKIEDFFDFYWDSNPLGAIKSEEDNKFISELPRVVS
jgi:hypothetical protein